MWSTLTMVGVALILLAMAMVFFEAVYSVRDTEISVTERVI